MKCLIRLRVQQGHEDAVDIVHTAHNQTLSHAQSTACRLICLYSWTPFPSARAKTLWFKVPFAERGMAWEGRRLHLCCAHVDTNPVSIQFAWRPNEHTFHRGGGDGHPRTRPLALIYSPLPPPPLINQTRGPLWSVVSCYLVTSCHDLPGPLVFPWWLCPFCRLLAASWLFCPSGL